jgi:hypothetical protein
VISQCSFSLEIASVGDVPLSDRNRRNCSSLPLEHNRNHIDLVRSHNLYRLEFDN